MLGLILVGAVFIALGLAVRLLLRLKRWVRNVIETQNRLPRFVRGGRRETSERDAKRGVLAVSYFAMGFAPCPGVGCIRRSHQPLKLRRGASKYS